MIYINEVYFPTIYLIACLTKICISEGFYILQPTNFSMKLQTLGNTESILKCIDKL